MFPIYWIVNPMHPQIRNLPQTTTCLTCKFGGNENTHRVQTILREPFPRGDTRDQRCHALACDNKCTE